MRVSDFIEIKTLSLLLNNFNMRVSDFIEIKTFPS